VKDAGTGVASDYMGTYISKTWTVALTKSWQQFSFKVTVPQEFLNSVKALYKAGKTNAYDVILRMDGSQGALKGLKDTNLSGFTYLVDEATIIPPVKATDKNGNTPTAQSVVARQFTFTQQSAYFCSNTWTFVTADMVKNGTVTYKVTIGNASKDTISLTAKLQALGKVSDKDQWLDVTDMEADTYDLDPNESHTFTVTAAAESEMGDAKTKTAYTSYFLRLDGTIPAGAVLIFTGISAENLAKMTFTNTTTTDLYQLPSWMKGATPTTSGDTVLYAAAACAVISAIGLVYVVSRKKNEEEA